MDLVEYYLEFNVMNEFSYGSIDMEVGAFYHIGFGLFRSPGRLQNTNGIISGLNPTQPPFDLLPHPYGNGPIVGGQLLSIINEANGSQSYMMGNFLTSREGERWSYAPYPDQNLQLRVPDSWGQGRYGGRYHFSIIPREQIPRAVINAMHSRNTAVSNVYEQMTNQNSTMGEGPANVIRGYAGIMNMRGGRRRKTVRKVKRKTVRKAKKRN